MKQLLVKFLKWGLVQLGEPVQVLAEPAPDKPYSAGTGRAQVVLDLPQLVWDAYSIYAKKSHYKRPEDAVIYWVRYHAREHVFDLFEKEK